MRRFALSIAIVMVLPSCAALGLAGDCEGTEVTGLFREVGDLVQAANVQSSDVKIGQIREIELAGWEAKVTMCLDPDQRISADSEAIVRSTSLLGEKFVDLKEQTPGPPFLQDGDVLDSDQTGKATELEEVFAKLASILGAGNLEQINRFTHAQAEILRDHAGDIRNVLHKLRRFTDTLDSRRGDIGTAIDSLDSVARTTLADAGILEQFLDSFAGSSTVLADQKEGLESLLRALDDFTVASVQLLRQTRGGVEEQLRKLRPVLRVVVESSDDLRRALTTLATFAEWWPESMPGDYLQLDVCQASPDSFGQGLTCPQNLGNSSMQRAPDADSDLDFILRSPLRGESP